MVHAAAINGRRQPSAHLNGDSKTAHSGKTPDPVDQKVGLKVRTRRIQLGMSQDRLGAHLGVTLQQVQKYEKGTNRIGSSRMAHIATALEAPISFFYEGVQQTRVTPIDPVTALS